MRRSLSILAVLLVVGCGGGSDGPTAPPAPTFPAAAGTWAGVWNTFVPINTTASFAQDGSQITGTLTILNITAPITGVLSTRRPGGGGTLTLTGRDASCAFFDAQMDISSNELTMSGTATLNGLDCPDPSHYTGNMILNKSVGGADYMPSTQGTLEDIARQLQRNSP